MMRKLGVYDLPDSKEPGLVLKGPVNMEDGKRYVGQFKGTKRHGKGKLVWDDYSLY